MSGKSVGTQFKPALNEEQVIAVLKSGASNAELGRRYGVSRQAIEHLRYGRTYRTVATHVERWQAPNSRDATCWKCVHHACYFERSENSKCGSTNPKIACGIGFPDPLAEGARFARFCNLYQEAEA